MQFFGILDPAEDHSVTFDCEKHTDDDFRIAIGTLTSLLTQEGAHVEFGHALDSNADKVSATIQVATRYHTYEKIFYAMLHEVGHLIIFNDERDGNANGFVDYPGRVSTGQLYEGVITRSKENSRARRIAALHEELDAWREGLKLAIDFEFPVHIARFNEVMNQWVGTYVLGAAEVCNELK